jgi:hypothetical protein
VKKFNFNIRNLSIILMLSAQGLHAAITPVNLKCGSWINPLGIDDPNPRLSWQVVSTSSTERAQAETAYEIQVASSAALLTGNTPDLWDSSEIVGKQPFGVLYAGKTLTSVEQVFWRVRVWDVNNQAGAWSPAATWTMGLLKSTDWQGGWLVPPVNNSATSLTGCAWIWYPEGTTPTSAPVGTRYFRKAFSVRSNSALTAATLLMAADNSYTAYLNGTAVGSGSDWTTVIPLSVLSKLQSGTNLLAVAAANGGTSPNPAGLIGKLILNYADGTQTNIQMDATWLAANTLQPNWQSSGFNASSWVPALVLGSYGISPWNTGTTVQTALPIFRRQFTVNPGLQRAVIFICGLGQYELSANGAKVGNAVLAPGWSAYNKTCLYDSLDLTSYLTSGNNALGVVLGNGMYNVPATANYSKFTGSYGPPKVIAQIYLFYTNGTSQVISSDSQWLTTPGPITYSHVYGGEYYDARLLPAGWSQAGLTNISGWSAASVTTGPGGVLRGQSHAAPPIVVTQTLTPVQTKTFSSSYFVYDLGQNAAILASLTAHGPAGSIIAIEPAELTNSDGSIDRNSVGGGTAYWQYTLAGTGEESWASRFFYQGCRYVQVTLTPAAGSSQLPVLDSLSGLVIQSSVTSAGSFACSNDIFNRTRNITRWAQRNNLISILTDCPTRERLGWLEQYNLHGPSLHYEFDCGPLFAKTLQDMTDSQLSSGLVPSIAPEVTVFSGGYRDSPEWGSSSIIVPWQHYLYTGDDTLLRRYYSTMTNYFAYLQKQSANNFLNYPNGLGDWYDIGPNPPGFSQDTPISLTADAYYCQDAQILAQAAAELGFTSDANRFSLLATNIGNAFNTTYYSAANGYYATGSQTAQALPLYLGIVNPSNQSKVLSTLIANVNSVGLTSGEIGHRYLLRALTDNGRPDVVYTLHSGTNGPGYGDILSKGATALTEAWDANSSDSQDHFMLGHITEWFYHDLAGIQLDPTAPGFQHIIIKPAFISGISSANASYNSVRGTIASSWSVTNNQSTLNVTIPVGATAAVYLPILANINGALTVKESGTTIWQNNATSSSATGVTFNQVQGTGAQTVQIWNVGSGSYQFTWNVLLAPTGLQAAGSNGKVTLSWNPVAKATGYNVKRSTTSGSGYVNVASAITSTNYTDSAVTNNTTYYYVVSSLCGSAESVNSTESAATPGFFANPGFETPSVGTYQYSPAGAGWTFSAQSGGNGAGICANGSAFNNGNPNAPQGAQVAFLQGLGSISQTFTGLVPGSNYVVSFYAAQRNNIYGQQLGQTWQVLIDGTVVGSFAPAESAQSYAAYTASFTATALTSHIISFVGTDTNGGDNTVFIDNVNLTLVTPLPPQVVVNAGFETPSVGTYQYSPTGAGWTFSTQSGGNGAGICANGSAFNSSNPNAPQGIQVAFLQGLGSISQTFTGLVAKSSYQVSFYAAQRNNIYGQQLGQTWQLLLDGAVIGNYAPAESAQSYVVYTANFTASALTNHTITFAGTDTNGGDNTIFIDNVNLTPVKTTGQALSAQLTPQALALTAYPTSPRQLAIVWPVDHAGWQLQAQTSSLTGGLGTNWVTVPGSELSTQFNCTVDPGLGSKSVFFRLVPPQ